MSDLGLNAVGLGPPPARQLLIRPPHLQEHQFTVPPARLPHFGNGVRRRKYDDEHDGGVDPTAPGESWPNLEQFGPLDFSVMSDNTFGVTEQHTSTKKRKNVELGVGDPTAHEPGFEFSESDGALLQRMAAALTTTNQADNTFEEMPAWLDWKAVADAGTSVEEAQQRWVSLTTAISKRRTMMEILRAVQRRFEVAKLQGQVNVSSDKRARKKRAPKNDASPLGCRVGPAGPKEEESSEPRRPEKSGYHLFALHERGRIEKMDFAQTQKAIASRWQALDESQKAHWNNQLELKRAEYQREIEAWLASLSDEQRHAYHQRERLNKKRRCRERLRQPQKPTAYRLFIEAHLPQLENQYPDKEKAELIKRLKYQWKELSEPDRAVFRERTKQAMIEYHRQCLEYDERMRLMQAQNRGDRRKDKEDFGGLDGDVDDPEDDEDDESTNHDLVLAMEPMAPGLQPPEMPAPVVSMGAVSLAPPLPLDALLFCHTNHPGAML